MDGDNSFRSVNTSIVSMETADSCYTVHDKPEQRDILKTIIAQQKTYRDTNSAPMDESQISDGVASQSRTLNSNASLLRENGVNPSSDQMNSLSANPSEFMALIAPLIAQSSRSTCAENLAMHGAPEGTTIPFKQQQPPESLSHLERSNKEFDPLPKTLFDKNSVDESNLNVRIFSQENLNVWPSESAPQQPTDEQFCHEVQDEQSKKDVVYNLDGKCCEDYCAQGPQARLDETATVACIPSSHDLRKTVTCIPSGIVDSLKRYFEGK